MTDQKPTGVFIRLPNDAIDPQWAKAYDAVVGDEGTKKAALWDFIQIAKAIGTPVTGGGLDYCAQIIWHKGELEPEIAAWKGSKIQEGDNIKVVRQSEAQAQIAERDAEIVRLRDALNDLVKSSKKVNARGTSVGPQWIGFGVSLGIAEYVLKGGAA